jgi:hypothetical protein
MLTPYFIGGDSPRSIIDPVRQPTGDQRCFGIGFSRLIADPLRLGLGPQRIVRQL